MKDFLGQDLAIDDNVVYITPNYRDYSVGKIVKFTPKNVVVAIKYSAYSNNKTILQSPSQLIKYDPKCIPEYS